MTVSKSYGNPRHRQRGATLSPYSMPSAAGEEPRARLTLPRGHTWQPDIQPE